MLMEKLSPARTETGIIRWMNAKKVPFVKGSPGIGKSDIIRKIAKRNKLKVIDFRLSQATPEDMLGLPFRDQLRAAYAAFKHFPLITDTVPEGYNGWLLYLDEFNSGSKAVTAASYKLVLDQMVDQTPLHPACAIVCSGNLDTDNAIVTRQGTAIQSRLVHLHMGYSSKEFRTYMIQNNWDQRILGFTEYMPQKVYVFDPDHNDETFACPRTWSFVNDLLKHNPEDAENLENLLPEISGAITSGIAVEFVKFSQEFNDIPKFSSILKDPKHAVVPMTSPTRFATLSAVLYNTDKDNLDTVLEYVNRYRQEEMSMFYKSIIDRIPGARDIPQIAMELIKLMRFLDEEDDATI